MYLINQSIYRAHPLGCAQIKVITMSTLKLRAFNLTVSVRGDIKPECVKAVLKYVKRNAKYFRSTVENKTKEGNPCKRHLHVCWFTEEPIDGVAARSNIWQRYVKKWHPDSIGRVAVQNQACPGRKWVDEYLEKTTPAEEDTQCDLPENLDDLNEYFPTKEQQEELKKLSNRVFDEFFSTHEMCYRKWLEEHTWHSTMQTAMEYFHWRMFVQKDMPVVADSRKVHQWGVALHRYTVEDYKLTPKELAAMQQEAQEFAFKAP